MYAVSSAYCTKYAIVLGTLPAVGGLAVLSTIPHSCSQTAVINYSFVLCNNMRFNNKALFLLATSSKAHPLWLFGF